MRGTALQYGAVARKYGEAITFEAGSFGNVGKAQLTLTLHHDRARPVAAMPDGGLRLTDTAEALLFEADLAPCPDGDAALALIRAGVLKGASIEAGIVASSVNADVRRVTRSVLQGLSLVDRPAFATSGVRAWREAGRPHRGLLY